MKQKIKQNYYLYLDLDEIYRKFGGKQYETGKAYSNWAYTKVTIPTNEFKAEVLLAINNQLDAIPDDAVVEFFGDYPGDYLELMCNIWSERDETDEELADREKEEQKNQLHKDWEEASLYNYYLKLKEKYESNC